MLTPTTTQEITAKNDAETLPEISPAQYLSELVRLLQKQEDTIFGREGINNNRVLCARLDEIVDLLGDKNRKTEALGFLSSFDTVLHTGKREIENLLNEFYLMEDIGASNRPDEDNILGTDQQGQYRKIEILRKIFIAFGVVKSESIGGKLGKPTNLILKAYEGHIIDKFYGRTGMIDFDKFLDYDKLTPTNEMLFLGLREVGTGELISEVVGIVEAIHGADTGEDGESIEDVETRGSRPSWRKQGAKRRRLRYRETKDKRTQEELQKEREREYKEKIQELKSYGEQVKSELQRLQGFLLTHIPYVTEVLDYLHLDHRLKQEGYLEEGENIGDMRSQILGTIEGLESDCSILRSTIHTLEADISGLSSSLIQINSDGLNNGVNVRTLQKRLDKKTAKIDREKRRLEEVESELQRISDSAEDIISQLEGFRFKRGVPNIDEFEAGIYYSLDAENMYSMPERINQPPVTVQWIEQNILHIFRKILGRYFEWDYISIVDIWDLVEKIDTLEPEYHEDNSISDTETIDLSSIRDFIDTLLTIIPQKYIDEVPVFGNGKFKIITPEAFMWNPPKIKQQKPQIDQGRKRKIEEKNKRNAILDEKMNLRKEITIMEEKMMQYIQYWNNKLRVVFRKKRAITSDIENMKNNMSWKNSNRGKTIEELDILLKEVSNEFEVIQKKIQNNTSLLQNQTEYDELEKERGALQRKLQSLK